MKKIALIGSTGSIGRQVLNVVRRHSEKFQIVSMSAGNNFRLFAEQVKEFSPKIATISTKEGARFCKEVCGKSVEYGENSFTSAIIDEADIIIVALVGFKGIIAVIDAIKKGKNIALANKESLVVGGGIVMALAKERGVTIVPIDSEHSAIWQALDFDFKKPFSKLILTASGGAFRDYDIESLKTVRAKDALKHPNWDMGAKITIDCATLVNKAFEVIEAKWLYNTTFAQIDVIIHRESIIHSMVEFLDGSVLAQMSYPTMELPIQIALTYPERYNSGVSSLDFAKIGKLNFEAVDYQKYPSFNLILQSAKLGGNFPAVANSANEVAVKLFLEDKISFCDIYSAIDFALNDFKDYGELSYESVCRADEETRQRVWKKFAK